MTYSIFAFFIASSVLNTRKRNRDIYIGQLANTVGTKRSHGCENARHSRTHANAWCQLCLRAHGPIYMSRVRILVNPFRSSFVFFPAKNFVLLTGVSGIYRPGYIYSSKNS